LDSTTRIRLCLPYLFMARSRKLDKGESSENKENVTYILEKYMLLNEIHCIKEKSHIQNCFIGNKYYYVLHPESINVFGSY
jgi:hypothetical protein